MVSEAIFPINWGIFVLRSGLRFSFWALEVPEPRVRKRPLSLTNMAKKMMGIFFDLTGLQDPCELVLSKANRKTK